MEYKNLGKPFEAQFLKLYNCDCMDLLKQTPDNYYSLCIVDPPYGIGRDGSKATTSKHGGRKAHDFKGWDNNTPNAKYFDELRRVSKDQIIWGANYYPQHLSPSMGWIFWDKGQRICNSDGELAYSSFDRALRVIEMNRVELLKDGTIHPTQKPVKLYSWLLRNYAKEGDKILDTHLGSMSSVIACIDAGFHITGCELDKDYYNAGIERIKRHLQQQTFQFLRSSTPPSCGTTDKRKSDSQGYLPLDATQTNERA